MSDGVLQGVRRRLSSLTSVGSAPAQPLERSVVALRADALDARTVWLALGGVTASVRLGLAAHPAGEDVTVLAFDPVQTDDVSSAGHADLRALGDFQADTAYLMACEEGDVWRSVTWEGRVSESCVSPALVVGAEWRLALTGHQPVRLKRAVDKRTVVLGGLDVDEEGMSFVIDKPGIAGLVLVPTKAGRNARKSGAVHTQPPPTADTDTGIGAVSLPLLPYPAGGDTAQRALLSAPLAATFPTGVSFSVLAQVGDDLVPVLRLWRDIDKPDQAVQLAQMSVPARTSLVVKSGFDAQGRLRLKARAVGASR